MNTPEPSAGLPPTNPEPASTRVKERFPALAGWGIIGAILLAVVIFAFLERRARLIHPAEMIALSNVRQLSAAADQYFLEYDVTSVAASQLVGPNGYVKSIRMTGTEVYPTIYRQGGIVTVTGVAGLRTITYAP